MLRKNGRVSVCGSDKGSYANYIPGRVLRLTARGVSAGET